MDHDDAIRMLEAVTAAFDQHDLDAIMEHIADDAVFDGPRGSDPWGTRFERKAAIREAFAARFSGIPDVRYGDDAGAVSRLAVEPALSEGPSGRAVEHRAVDGEA